MQRDGLDKIIEQKRLMMQLAANQNNNNLVHPDVVKASQELDELINLAMQKERR
ncbi:aspartyl-phosphate phosphatase Spo0E family protein [Paenibacillus sp. 2TAB26]|uniref:aspartyl-phosphate phosphatase Spo0E family protein n=1 Tax=Paenibacillus sp. 2TAB26 TaxID=3233005 RepID=UPI003F947ABC